MHSTILIYTILIILAGWGAAAGINYLADVLPDHRRLSIPFCRTCNSNLKINNYIFHKPCLVCRKKLSNRHLIVLIMVPLIFIYVYFYSATKLNVLYSFILISYYFLVAIIDIEHKVILYLEVGFGIIIGLITGAILHGIFLTILGGLAGFGLMYLLYLLGKIFSHIYQKNNEEKSDDTALGFGDVNLSGVLGLILGWPGITAGLLMAIFMGGIVSILIIVSQKIKNGYTPFYAIPYAPFLLISAFVLVFRP